MRLSTRKRPEDAARREAVGAEQAAMAAVRQEISQLRGGQARLGGALVVSGSGEVIAADVGSTPARELAVQVAAVAAAGPRLTAAAKAGAMAELTVRGVEGYVALYTASDRAVLAVLAEPTVNLGRLHLQARAAAERIGALLTATEPAEGAAGADS